MFGFFEVLRGVDVEKRLEIRIDRPQAVFRYFTDTHAVKKTLDFQTPGLQLTPGRLEASCGVGRTERFIPHPGPGNDDVLVGLDGITSFEQVTNEVRYDLAMLFLPVYIGLYLPALAIVSRYSIDRDGHNSNLHTLSGKEGKDAVSLAGTSAEHDQHEGLE